MWENIQTPLFFGLIAALVSTAGLIFIARQSYWNERNTALLAVISGGMLLTVTLTHVAPEALSLSAAAPALILLGFGVGLGLNIAMRLWMRPARLSPANVTIIDSMDTPYESLIPLLAIATHSFIDGMIYSVTFAASYDSGFLVALSMILHELPEGIIAFTLLKRYGASNQHAFFGAFICATLTTPLGVIVSALFVYALVPGMIGNLFALSAGLLFFVALSLLTGPVKRQRPAHSALALCIGVSLSFLISTLPLTAHG